MKYPTSTIEVGREDYKLSVRPQYQNSLKAVEKAYMELTELNKKERT